MLYYFLGFDEIIDNKVLVILLIALPDYLFSVSNDVASRYYMIDKRAKTYLKVISFSVFISGTINYYFIVHLEYGYLGWFISSSVFYLISFVFNAYLLYWKLKILPNFNFDTTSTIFIDL